MTATAAVYNLTKGGVTLSLVTSPYCFAGDMPIGSSGRSTELLYGDDGPLVGYVNEQGERRLPLAVEVRGTTGQGLEVSLNALIALLPRKNEEATITVQRTDGTAAGTITVVGYEQLDCAYGLARDVGAAAVLTVELICEPWVYAATETLYDASAVALPAVVPMDIQTGLAAAPWDTFFDFDALEAVALYAGRYPDPAAVIGDFARELVTAGAVAGVKGAWVDVSGTGAPASDDAGYGTAVAGNELWGTEGVCYTDLVWTDLEPGEYQLFVNAKSADAADPGTIHHPYCAPVSITGTTLHLYSLGTVTLPATTVRGSAASTLRLTLTGMGAGDAVYANAVFAIPTSFGGFVGWQRTSGHAHELRFEDGLVYADDVGALGEAFGGRQILGKGGTMVAIAEQATPAPTTAVALTASEVPRWEQFPSATFAHTNLALNPSFDIDEAAPGVNQWGGWWNSAADDWTFITDQPDIFATNDCPNPSFETDANANGLADDWATIEDQTPNPTTTQAASRSYAVPSNRYSQRIQCAPTDAGSYFYLYAESAAGTYAAGDPVTFSIWLKGAASAALGVRIAVIGHDAAHTGVGANTYSGAITLTTTWQRASVTIASLGATTDHVRVYVEVLAFDADETLDLYLDDAVIEKCASMSPEMTLVAGRVSGRAMRLNLAAAPDRTYAYLQQSTAAASFAANDPAILALYVKGTASGSVTVRPHMRAFDSGGTGLGAGNTYGEYVTLTTSWQRAQVSIAALPATTDYLRGGLELLGFDADETLDLYADDAQFDKRTLAFSFYDGSTADGQIVFDGDSWTADETYQTAVCAGITPAPHRVNLGVGGQTWANLLSDGVAQADPFYYARRAYNVLFCMSGVNDYHSAAAGASTAVLADLVAYCTARRAAGYTVVVGPCGPDKLAGVSADYDTNRAAHNAYLAANWSAFADGYADFTANTYIGLDNSPNDQPTYWANGAHPDADGYAVLATYVLAAVQGVLP